MLKPLAGKAARSVELCTAKINVYEGAVRSSKTVASLLAFCGFVRHAPPGALALVGRTERTAARNIIDVLVEWFGPKRARYVQGVGELHLFGRLIHVVGANDENARTKIQGWTLAGAYADEVTTWPESMWIMLTSRLSIEGAQLYGTCNPDGPMHWLLGWLERAALWVQADGTERRRDPDLLDTLDLHRFSFRLADNPHLPDAYVREVMRQYVGLWRRRLIEGEWCVASGAIFDMFDPARCVIDTLPEGVRPFAVGIDYGTAHRFHAVMLGIAPGGLYVMGEWWHDSAIEHRQMTEAQYLAAVQEWLGKHSWRPDYVVIDPSAASFRLACYRAGLPAMKGDNAVDDGLRVVASLLGADKLRIHSSCRQLIKDLPSYVWDERARLLGIEQPNKTNGADHGPDALRYAVKTTRGTWYDTIYR